MKQIAYTLIGLIFAWGLSLWVEKYLLSHREIENGYMENTPAAMLPLYRRPKATSIVYCSSFVEDSEASVC
jgi:hypothetical protein